MENIRPNGRNCFSNERQELQQTYFWKKIGISRKKRSGMKKLWKRFRLHFAIPTRQRDKEIMKRNIRNGKIQVNSRKIKKSATSGKISGEKYGIP